MITFIKIIHFLIKTLALYDYSHYICIVISSQVSYRFSYKPLSLSHLKEKRLKEQETK